MEPTRSLVGSCLHEGGTARVKVLPGSPGAGIRFIREDLPLRPVIPATLDFVQPGPRRTLLEASGVTVSTVEHLLSALWSLCIYDAEIVLRGPEVPILDGSALPFARNLMECSRLRRGAEGRCPSWRVVRGFARRQGIGSCVLVPSDFFSLDCRIQFSAFGDQWIRMVRLEQYLERYAPARTFGFVAERDALHHSGLARGATLSNVLIFDGREVLNSGGRRFLDEPVRHKVVDALGDVALLGGPLAGNLKLNCCSHALLVSTLREAIAAGALRV